MPPIVHFTWFYKAGGSEKVTEMKFFQMMCILAAYKKLKPHKILSE